MGPSSAFLGVLFLSGTLGKGRLGNPQGVGVGRREGLGRVGGGGLVQGLRMERKLTEVKRNGEI